MLLLPMVLTELKLSQVDTFVAVGGLKLEKNVDSPWHRHLCLL